MDFKFYSVGEIKQYLDSLNLTVNKSFGQNFLINAGVADGIVRAMDINEEDLVFEIGCGLGSLTNRILIKKPDFYGFEIDKGYITHLNKLFSSEPRFHLIAGDFLKTFEKSVAEIDRSKYRQTVFAGNLPYYITTPILDKIFKSEFGFDKIITMVQKEVAERITAGPGTKKYGSLSIFCQFYAEPKIISSVKPASFYPRPAVDSTVILFTKRKVSYNVKSTELFFKFVNSIFMNRRKQLKNNIECAVKLSPDEKEMIINGLSKSSVPLTGRGEELNIAKIVEIINNT